MKLSIIGLGFVGGSMLESFKIKTESNTEHTIYGYDKYKNGGIGTFEDCLDSDFIFLALPTEYDSAKKSYDTSIIEKVLDELSLLGYNKCIVIKSTVEPTVTENLQQKHKDMHLIHNPEFLTAKTAFEDFHNQTHIVIGKSSLCSQEHVDNLEQFYKQFYPDVEISHCTCLESESMKIYCNTFYAVKVQFFNELYLLSNKLGADYDTVVNLMLKNDWINPMHTKVPGPDGKLSYGGFCFPKDTNALLQAMKRAETPHSVLEACIEERNEMRDDNTNCK